MSLAPTAPEPGYSVRVKIALAPDGTELLWNEEGDGGPLLLLAGQATGMAGWGPAAKALARHFRVIRYDHRGVGGSGKGDAGRYTTRLLAEDAAAVLDAAGADSAHVYGHSMGGRIAQWLAIDHPDRVRTLVMAASSGGRRPGATVDTAALELLLSGDPERMAPLFFEPHWAEEHADAVRIFFGSNASAWAKARHFQASRAHDAWGSLESIQAPTLIIHGTEDALTPLEDAVLMRQGIPRSTLVKVPGARHGLHLDHPETIGWIRQFIASRNHQPARARPLGQLGDRHRDLRSHATPAGQDAAKG